MSRFLLNILNRLLNIAVFLFLAVSVCYAGYALWDNAHIYSAVDGVQEDMIKLRPEADKADNGKTFRDLREINPDVQAWISMDGTNIDYPVLQGKNNMSYINTDVYGKFALQGSIFMDSRSSPDFSQKYTILYGHHMDGGKMFGDLDRYKDRDFFMNNGSGELILPDRSFDLQVFGTLVLNAADDRIFSPSKWAADAGGLPGSLEGEFRLVKENMLPDISGSEDTQIIALTTCTSEFTDARTIVLAVMTPKHTAGMEE